MRKVSLAILLSGRGSNAAALIRACAEADFPARVAVVASDVPGAPGLDIARAAGIPVEAVDRKAHKGRAAFETALLAALKPHPADLVCLAGFMRVLTPTFIAAWPPGRILNIHPSLLPAYKGLNTHARALADGAAEHGCTVHIVTPELDSGPILVQKRVPVEAGDTADTLAARVLVQEHVAYVEALRAVATQILEEGTA
ncbi:MAG TPA: phosphoribosylglycinamide formyltransferase [Rhodospirillaceae bacterium]|jgi:phosphoribosylglycinamide formyltransferase-1|nr:phosphoribosylglycinamide formyltransferase [Alphaproteobacteria bacterium]HBH26177.1 phosphoribosylglycinamide formyltransferase [Rhodospirillaceae bacterium]